LDSAETPPALIPVRTTEQHGAHLAMGTDAVIPTEICERIAEDTNALVGPPINYGASDMHAGYDGISYFCSCVGVALGTNVPEATVVDCVIGSFDHSPVLYVPTVFLDSVFDSVPDVFRVISVSSVERSDWHDP